jgi:hypothetical protein
MTMEHVIACETKEIFHALFALYDLSYRSAQLTLETDIGWTGLHHILYDPCW